MKTKAIVFVEKNKVELQELPLGEMGDNDVLVDVDYSCVSPGTERWILTDQFDDGVSEDEGYGFPAVPGYQYAGRIRDIGGKVNNFKVGDRVFGSFNRFEGMRATWGGHSALAVCPADTVYLLPDNVSSKDAAGLVLAQVGYNGGIRPPVEPGDVAVVIGDGLIGQFAAQTLRSRGAFVVIVGKGDKERLDYARKFSCDMAVDAAEQDVKAVLNDIAPDGVNVFVEAIGIQEHAKMAYEVLKHDGHFVLNGFYPHGNAIELNLLCVKEITVYNPSSFFRLRMEKTLAVLSRGKLDIGSLLTHVVKSADAPQAYNDFVLDRKEFSLGLVIDWNDVR